jgi:hypothetical protein
LAEFEELVLSVRVDDQASAKLDQLKTSIAGLGGGSQAAGFERFKRQTDEINEALKGLTETLTKGPAALAGFARSAGAAGVAILGRCGRRAQHHLAPAVIAKHVFEDALGCGVMDAARSRSHCPRRRGSTRVAAMARWASAESVSASMSIPSAIA